jgi:hypothetical protein
MVAVALIVVTLGPAPTMFTQFADAVDSAIPVVVV